MVVNNNSVEIYNIKDGKLTPASSDEPSIICAGSFKPIYYKNKYVAFSLEVIDEWEKKIKVFVDLNSAQRYVLEKCKPSKKRESVLLAIETFKEQKIKLNWYQLIKKQSRNINKKFNPYIFETYVCLIAKRIIDEKESLDWNDVHDRFKTAFAYSASIGKDTIEEMTLAYCQNMNIKVPRSATTKTADIKDKTDGKLVSFKSSPGLVFKRVEEGYELVKIDSELRECRIREKLAGSPVRWVPKVFDGSLSLEKIEIDECLYDIFPSLVRNLKHLKSVKIGDRNLSFDNNVLMEGDKLVLYPSNLSGKSYVIPDYVKTIASGAFCCANNLGSIKIGKGVKKIESGAFISLSSLVYIEIPSNVETIEAGAFTRMRNLSLCSVNSYSDGISPSFFEDCRNLKKVVTKNGVLLKSFQEIALTSKSSSLELIFDETDKTENAPYLGRAAEIFVDGVSECIKANHSVDFKIVRIPILMGTKLVDTIVPVFKCLSCGKYFIPPELFEKCILNKGFDKGMSFSWIEYSPDYRGRRINSFKETDDGLNGQSILKVLGYNVAKTSHLTQGQRLKSIRDGIEHGVVSKEEVLYYLDYFVRYMGSKIGNESAREKWLSDIEVIRGQTYKRPNILY